MDGYGQYCPVAKAAELVDRRWTLLVRRHEGEQEPVYELTEAGAAFRPVIEALGEWGIRWIDALADEDLDPAFLLWDVHRRVDLAAVPEGRTVIGISFADLEPSLRDWWLVVTPHGVDVCEHDPGHGTDLWVDTEARVFVRVWRGDIAWARAVRDDTLRVRGPERLRRDLPRWLQLSYFSGVDRQR